MKLFCASSTVDNYEGYNGVVFYWFVHKRNKPLPLPYEDLIDGYWFSAQRGYPEMFLQECFTELEIEQLKAYLFREHGEAELRVSELEFPIPSNFMGAGGIAVGGMDDFLMLDTGKNYDLPFSVWGYFNLLDAEPIDKPTIFRRVE